MKKRVLTVKEIAVILDIGINQAYSLVRSDVIPHKKIGSRYVIPAELFEEWFLQASS